MARKVAIRKVGNSTIVDVKSNGTTVTKTITYNKNTDLRILNNVLIIDAPNYPTLFILHSELEDDLGTANLEDWNTAASALYYFTANVNGGGSGSSSGHVYSEEFTWNDGDPQVFAVPANTTVALVVINRVIALESEYTFSAPNVTITDPLDDPSIITILGFTTT